MEKGIEYLRKKLKNKQCRVDLRYKYYDMKAAAEDLLRVNAEFRWLAYSLGWCAKAVDSIADRIIYDGIDNDDFRIGQIYELNNSGVLFDSSVLSSLISSCSFLYIGKNDSGYPTIQVIDGGNATGEIDTTNNMLTEGYAVLERGKNNEPVLEAHMLPHKTMYYVNGRLDESLTFDHPAPYPLLVPVIYRPDAKRPFGHSRITRACMDVTQGVLRTFRRMEVSSEYYSYPQKYVLGLSENAQFNNRAASMSDFLDFRKDEDNDKPIVGQFQQQSMTPYVEELKAFASIFAGETGLTLDDLGFNTANPSNFDAIRASHEGLRLTARKAQRTYSTAFVNAGYLAACIRDNKTYDRYAFAKTRVAWAPIFEPDAAAIGAIGDAIFKVNQAVPGFIGARGVHRLTGLESDND